MRGVALYGDRPSGSRFSTPVETVEMAGVPVNFGRVEVPEPAFDSQSSEVNSMVLVRVRAFSCNFRDKVLILSWSRQLPDKSYCFVGSEFVGEVVAVGSAVTGLQEGDRVIANMQYPAPPVSGVLPGIPTNGASRRYLTLHQAKLMKVPENMPDEVAASFSIGAQTAYSMLRRLDIVEGTKALVTSARSNTSLFVIDALSNRGVDVYATSTTSWTENELQRTKLKKLIKIGPELTDFTDNEQIRSIVSEIGGFDYVVDPFFDLHVGKLVDTMSLNAKYITCGLYDQYSHLTGEDFRRVGRGLDEILAHAIVKNLHFIGNCLGKAEDLNQAIKDYENENLSVIIDSVFHGEQVSDFFDRTYNAKDRFGKVVYRYGGEG